MLIYTGYVLTVFLAFHAYSTVFSCVFRLFTFFSCVFLYSFFFFFSSRRRHTRCGRDWSSDVCSSDLYQSWDREIQANNGVMHLYEYYRWYGPVFEFGFLKQWDDIRVDFTAAASSLSDDLVVDLTHVDLNKPKLHLKSGLGYEAVIQISYSLIERWLLHAKHQQGYRYFPATDYVTDRRGFKQMTLNEPESKNYYHGFWLGVGYQF